jgi:hypothetical protein
MNASSCHKVAVYPLAVSVVLAVAAGMAQAANCDGGSFPSTFALIQTAIFENRGCTNSLCHGAAKQGGLDLRSDSAYQSLVDVDAVTVSGMKRVLAGEKDRSLLWINLAAKTYPDRYTAPVRPMPLDPVPALTDDELEAVRLWIEKGAPQDGVIPGTDTLLNACLPPPEPIVVKPLPAPPAGEGVQLRMPPWTLDAHSEREVCFASYYDLTAQVPPQFRGPNGTTFRYKFNAIRQTPMSHHLIVNLYSGNTPPTSSDWGVFHCRGGAHDGDVCDPLDLTFCGEGLCATDPVNSIACIGFADAGLGINSAGFTGTQETASEFEFAPGVYREIPLKGMILWNSHAFNLTDTAGTLDAWLNFEFAAPAEQQTPAEQIFDTDSIFKMRVPAFTTEEVCAIEVLPQNAHLYELSSHGHKRMKRWRTFEGAFTCQGGPKAGEACSPFGPDFDSPDICAGAPCASMVAPRVGDCDGDGTVTIDELVRAVRIAAGSSGLAACPDADTNGDQTITVDDVITCVDAALNGVPASAPRDAQSSLLYVSLIYNDPVVLHLNPPMVMSSASPGQRSLTYCALYDNGFTNPSEVKTRATSPPPPIAIGGVGGPCQTPTNCTAGKVGEPCKGNNDARRNASCDTTAGAGDGVCDACTLTGGVTTEDEMFILLGQYFVR